MGPWAHNVCGVLGSYFFWGLGLIKFVGSRLGLIKFMGPWAHKIYEVLGS